MTTNIKLTIKQLILNTKYIIKNKLSIFFVLFFPILSLTLPLFFIPLRYSFSVYLAISIIIPLFILYINIFYKWRSGTLYKNLNTSKNNKYLFYISAFILLYIIMMSATLYTLVIIHIFDELNLILFDYAFKNSENIFEYRIFTIPMWPLIYSLSEYFVVMFGMFFFLQNIINNEKTMYIFLLVIMVLIVIFGGAFNPYFVGKQRIQFISGTEGVPPTDTIKWHFKWTSEYNPYLFPNYMFYPTSLLPFFGPSQHLASLGTTFVYILTNSDGDLFHNKYLYYDDFIFFTFHNQNTFSSIKEWFTIPKTSDMIKWNSLWFMSYIWVIIFITGGISLSKFNNK